MKNYSDVYEQQPITTAIGTIVDINPNTFSADVVLSGGASLQGVGFVGFYGSPIGQDVTWLYNLRGATVKLSLIGHEYFIIHSIPYEIYNKEEAFTHSIPVTKEGVGGDDALTYKNITFSDYSANRNTAFLSSDKVLRADPDIELSLWRGGIARLKASPLAQFILGKYKDFARLIARVYQFYSDFGEVKSTHNSEGRVGLSIKGGAVFSEETHPGMANWTVQIWAGDDPTDPDSRLKIRVNNKENTEFVELKYDINGTQTFEASRDDNQVIGNNREHIVSVDDSLAVGGDSDTIIAGDKTVTVGGSREDNITDDAKTDIGGAWDIKVGGPVNIVSETSVVVTAPSISMN